jgi:CheY-like chemotaxis protein
MRLMIVDDNKMMRKTKVQMIEQKEDEILECYSGKEAVEKYSGFNPYWMGKLCRFGKSRKRSDCQQWQRFCRPDKYRRNILFPYLRRRGRNGCNEGIVGEVK